MSKSTGRKGISQVVRGNTRSSAEGPAAGRPGANAGGSDSRGRLGSCPAAVGPGCVPGAAERHALSWGRRELVGCARLGPQRPGSGPAGSRRPMSQAPCRWDGCSRWPRRVVRRASSSCGAPDGRGLGHRSRFNSVFFQNAVTSQGTRAFGDTVQLPWGVGCGRSMQERGPGDGRRTQARGTEFTCRLLPAKPPGKAGRRLPAAGDLEQRGPELPGPLPETDV